MNPMQMIQGIRHPKEMVQRLMNNNSNPILKDLVQKLEQGDSKSVENFAKNIFKEQGRDFDSEFTQFMKNFK